MRLILLLLLILLVGLSMASRPDESAHRDHLDSAGPGAVQTVAQEEFDLRLPDLAADGIWRTLRASLRWEYRNRYLFSTMSTREGDEQRLVSVGAFNTVVLIGPPQTWLRDQLDTLRNHPLLDER